MKTRSPPTPPPSAPPSPCLYVCTVRILCNTNAEEEGQIYNVNNKKRMASSFFALFTSFLSYNLCSYKTPQKKGDTCLERLRETRIFFVTSYIIPLFLSLPPISETEGRWSLLGAHPFTSPFVRPFGFSLSLPRRNYGGRPASSSSSVGIWGEELSRKR